jgi:hypothetical protein
MRALLTERCWCGRPGAVLWDHEFWCGSCALLLVGDDPAAYYAALDMRVLVIV